MKDQLKSGTRITGKNEFERYTEIENLLSQLNDYLHAAEIPVKKKLLRKMTKLEHEIFDKRRNYQINLLVAHKVSANDL